MKVMVKCRGCETSGEVPPGEVTVVVVSSAFLLVGEQSHLQYECRGCEETQRRFATEVVLRRLAQDPDVAVRWDGLDAIPEVER